VGRSPRRSLEFTHVQPERVLRVKANVRSISKEEAIAGQAAADLSERGGEGTAGIVFRPVTPEELGQVIAAVSLAPMHDQVCQQRLRPKGRRKRQLAGGALRRLPAVEAQPAQTADLEFRCHRTPRMSCSSGSRRSAEASGC
jgi:hypothetical protein